MSDQIYKITGMHCSSCIDKIKNAFIPAQVEVTLTPPRLKIKTDNPISLEELNATIAKAGNYQLEPLENLKSETTKTWLQIYYPIFLIAIYITAISLLTSSNKTGINWMQWMNNFMAGFFLVFSAFKMLDLKGFADAYATYDLLAHRNYRYGFVYPFLELFLGILYLKQLFPLFTCVFTILLMTFSSFGVIKALMKKQKIRCACLGTILNVPMSSITLIEDLLMVLMATIMLIQLL